MSKEEKLRALVAEWRERAAFYKRTGEDAAELLAIPYNHHADQLEAVLDAKEAK